jgi:hypothetical protein
MGTIPEFHNEQEGDLKRKVRIHAAITHFGKTQKYFCSQGHYCNYDTKNKIYVCSECNREFPTKSRVKFFLQHSLGDVPEFTSKNNPDKQIEYLKNRKKAFENVEFIVSHLNNPKINPITAIHSYSLVQTLRESYSTIQILTLDSRIGKLYTYSDYCVPYVFRHNDNQRQIHYKLFELIGGFFGRNVAFQPRHILRK